MALNALRHELLTTAPDPTAASSLPQAGQVLDRVESMRHQRGFMTSEPHQPLHCTYAQSSPYEWYARPTDRVPSYFAAG